MNNLMNKYEQMETPFFLIDKEQLDFQVEQLKKAVQKYWDNSILGYSFKTNSLPWVIEYFKNQGFYAEVVSDDEYNLAKLVGYDRKKYVYNGIIKSKDTFLEAIENGCVVNIDSEKEVEWLRDLDLSKSYSIGIRVNFDLETYCPGHTQCGDEGGRFGFCYENGELERIINIIDGYPHIEIKGVHMHCSSKTRGLEVYQALAKMACEVKKNFDLKLNYVDIGGGFFGGLKNKPQFDDYLACVSKELEKEFDKNSTVLILEPGMSLIGSPISFVTSVIDVKKTNRNIFVVTDGSRNNIDPLMSKKSYFNDILMRNLQTDKALMKKQVISGYTCMEHDRLFTLENHVELQEGDMIVYDKVGAYTMCLSPLFIKYFPKVYVKDQDNYLLVRERWTENEIVKQSIGWK